MMRGVCLLMVAFAIVSCSDPSVAGKSVVDETTNGIQVRLTLPDGTPAVGARVVLASSSHLAGDTSRVHRAVADASGWVDLPGIPRGAYRLEAQWQGWGIAQTRDLRTSEGRFATSLSLLARLQVQVPPGSLLRAYGSDRSWKADGLGQVTLDSLPAGIWNLRADSTGTGKTLLLGERAVEIAPAEDTTIGDLDGLILDPATWSRSQVLRIDADLGGTDSSMADVPVPVRIGSDAFEAGLRTPSELRIVSSDGQDLPFEIEDWDAAGGTTLVWIRLPTTIPSRGDSLTLLWGKPGIPDRSLISTDSVFGWWRFGALPASVADSGTSVAPGILGKARSFDGNASLRLKAPSDSALAAGFTVSCWIDAEGAQRPWAKILDLGGSWEPYGTIVLDIDSATGKPGFQLAFSDSTWKRVSGSQAMSGWTHLAARWDSQARRGTFFVNGVSQGFLQADTTLLTVVGHDLVVGNQESGGDGLTGRIDDLRFELLSRSDSWIRHQAFLLAPDRIRARTISKTP